MLGTVCRFTTQSTWMEPIDYVILHAAVRRTGIMYLYISAT